MAATNNDDQDDRLTYPLPTQKEKVIQPLSSSATSDNDKADDNPALSLLRHKINDLYSQEPDPKQEMEKAETAGNHRTKHQQFMHELSHSGKSLAEIQTEWHNYYVSLPDKEKHDVWQEFYAVHNARRHSGVYKKEDNKQQESIDHNSYRPGAAAEPKKIKAPNLITASDIKKKVLRKVSSRSQAAKKKSQHLHSMLFGLSMGFLALLIMLFGFFNERFVAPFITPSRSVSSTPIIMDPNSTEASGEPKLIIPKINLEVPVVFDEPSVEEKAVQRALEDGVLHYATTSLPGEEGNSAIFGHSSNNILNRGKYKFAFVLLNRLEDGDLFYVQRDGTRYAYQVYKKNVVSPTELAVLNNQEEPATMSLITCDPPGTVINRLVVVGKQINPDPNQNVASNKDKRPSAQAEILPSNAPSLWDRIRGWFTG
jgi:sortase A